MRFFLLACESLSAATSLLPFPNHGISSSAYLNANSLLISGTSASSPGIVARITLSNFSVAFTLTLAADETDAKCIVVDSRTGIALLGVNTRSSGPRVVRLATAAGGLQRVDALPLTGVTGTLSAASIDSASGYAFFAIAPNAVLVRVRLSPFGTFDTSAPQASSSSILYAAVLPPSAANQTLALIAASTAYQFNTSSLTLIGTPTTYAVPSPPITLTLSAGIYDSTIGILASTQVSILGPKLINSKGGGQGQTVCAADKLYAVAAYDPVGDCAYFGGAAGELATAPLTYFQGGAGGSSLPIKSFLSSLAGDGSGSGNAAIDTLSLDTVGGFAYVGTSMDAGNVGYFARISLYCNRLATASTSPITRSASTPRTPSVSTNASPSLAASASTGAAPASVSAAAAATASMSSSSAASMTQTLPPSLARTASTGASPSITSTTTRTVLPSLSQTTSTGASPSITATTTRTLLPSLAQTASTGASPSITSTSMQTALPSPARTASTGASPSVSSTLAPTAGGAGAAQPGNTVVEGGGSASGAGGAGSGSSAGVIVGAIIAVLLLSAITLAGAYYFLPSRRRAARARSIARGGSKSGAVILKPGDVRMVSTRGSNYAVVGNPLASLAAATAPQAAPVAQMLAPAAADLVTAPVSSAAAARMQPGSIVCSGGASDDRVTSFAPQQPQGRRGRSAH